MASGVITDASWSPDVATGACVHYLHVHWNLPVYGIADCDIYGIRILEMYSTGTIRGESIEGRGNRYAIPKILWLGLCPLQVLHLLEVGFLPGINYCVLPTSVLRKLSKDELDSFAAGDLYNDACLFVANHLPAQLEEIKAMENVKVQLQALYCLGISFASVFFGSLLDQEFNRRENEAYTLEFNADIENAAQYVTDMAEIWSKSI
jgi:DNA topoisomerase VI subunit A